MKKFDIKDYNSPVIILSCITDKTKEKELFYKVKPLYTDTYLIKVNNVEFNLYDKKGNNLNNNLNLTKNEEYYLNLTVLDNNKSFLFEVQSLNNKAVLPFESVFKYKKEDFKVNDNNEVDPLKPAKIEYIKRKEGLYINCNNPETLDQSQINKCFCRDVLKGNIFFTFEHNNSRVGSTYYGYMVKNTSKKDVFITIRNIGYHDQGPGSWLGQNEWIQFYNTDFRYETAHYTKEEQQTFLDEYNFDSSLKPLFNQPLTYRLPVGEQMFVLGGTTDLSYNNYNVFDTANRLVTRTCSNGAVYFSVSDEVEGSFYVYDKTENLELDNVQGYVLGAYVNPFGHAEDYGIQYQGSDECCGVIDNEVFWEFNDITKEQFLPVTYVNEYSKDAQEQGVPYSKIPNVKKYTQNRTDWVTHLNPQSNEGAVCTDMTLYKTVDKDNNKIVIHPNYYDGRGGFANIGNWMIGYQDRFTFVNKGDKDREVTLNYTDKGSTAILIRDEDGNVLDALYTLSKIGDNTYRYKMIVKAHSVYQMTFEYNLLANSYGNVLHSVYLK